MIKLDQRQKIVLFALCFGHICNGLTDAIQAPFYPSVASSKGVSPTIIGLIFGVYKLSSFCVSPICGHFISAIGSKLMMLSGIFIVSICSILFGFIDRIDNYTLFVILSFLIRIVESVGNSCYLTSSYSIAVEEFQENTMFIVSLMETSYAIGTIISPSLGGILYEVGGFMSPFISIGIFLIATGIIISIQLPKSDTKSEKSNYNASHLLRNFDFTLLMLANSVGFYNMGLISATLSIHLEQFDLSVAYVGLTFLATGLSFAIATPICAYLANTYIELKTVILMGYFCMILGFIFMGPAPHIPLTPTLVGTVISLLFNGFGIGATTIASFLGSQKEALRYGLPNDLRTFGLVSGLWTSAIALGYFTGPIFGGYLLENFGFQYASMSVIILSSFLIFLNLLQILLEKLGFVRIYKVKDNELSSFIQDNNSYTNTVSPSM